MSKRKHKYVLSCPAGYYLDEIHGSEDYWPLQIMNSVVQQSDFEYVAVTNMAKLYNSYSKIKIIEFQKRPSKLQQLGRLIFIFRYSLVGCWLILRYKPAIFHHVLPFGYKQTFNPALWLAHFLKIPIVVGPLQAPQTYDEPGDVNVSLRDFSNKDSRFINRINNIALKLSPKILSSLNSKTLLCANYLIAINEESAEFYKPFLSSTSKIHIIPAGISINDYSHVEYSDSSSSNVVIASTGYLIKRKGFDTLLAAFATLAKKYPNIRLQIIGKGPQEDELRNFCDNNGLSDLVEFVGFVPHPDIPSYIHNCDIFCLASRSDIFPNVLLEALASGRPIVATKTIGGKSIVNDGEQGFLAEVGDAESLALALAKLIEDPQLRIKIGKRNRKLAEERYDWKYIGQHYLRIYEELTRNLEINIKC